MSSEMCQVSRGKRREVAVGVWQATSDCYYNCVSPGSGIRLVEKRTCHQCNSSASIQLCKPDSLVCISIYTKARVTMTMMVVPSHEFMEFSLKNKLALNYIRYHFEATVLKLTNLF